MNVPDADREDLLQEVLIRLSRNVDKYERSRAGFRTWLSTIIRNCVLTFFTKENKRQYDPETHPELLDENKATELEEMIDREWKAYLTTLAMEKVRGVFRGNAIEAFELTQQGMPSQEIAERLLLSTESVYVLATRVRKRFILETKKLISELEY